MFICPGTVYPGTSHRKYLEVRGEKTQGKSGVLKGCQERKSRKVDKGEKINKGVGYRKKGCSVFRRFGIHLRTLESGE